MIYLIYFNTKSVAYMKKSLLVLGCMLLISLFFVGCASAESSLDQGTWNASPTTPQAVIQNTAALVELTPTPTLRLKVTLAAGSTFSIAPVNNLSSSITVNRTSALGALDAAATAGKFDYTIKTTDWGPFINSIGDYTYNETTWDSWLYMVNGVTAEVGAADYHPRRRRSDHLLVRSLGILADNIAGRGHDPRYHIRTNPDPNPNPNHNHRARKCIDAVQSACDPRHDPGRGL